MKVRQNFLFKAILFLLGDALIILGSSLFLFYLLDSFSVVSIAFPLYTTMAFASYSLISLGAFKMYQVNWKYTGLRESLFIFLGLLSGFLLTQITLLLTNSFSLHHFSYSILLFLTSLLLVGTFRISRRMLTEILTRPVFRKRAVIFGAGNAADQLLRDFSRHHHWSLNVVALFDDNEKLHGLNLHGIRIMGDRKRMYAYLRYSDVDELIIAIPSLPKSELKKITDEVHSVVANLKVKVLPSYHLLSDEPVGFRDIRRISIEDVLGREPVRSNIKAIEAGISGKRVLITGAGGSIGSEIVKQCLSLEASKVIALDVDETELFYLMNEFAHLDGKLEPCVANVTDEIKMNFVFQKHRPEVIFHAAAYKHVPMMEKFPEEAVKVNIGGTRLMSRLSLEYGAEKFILISTDKAVNPTNVMGATKRVAEEVSLSFNGLGTTKFIAVRFGNVLGSRGSVLPLFIEQIKNGGPITITHKDIKRYFMTIPEAVLLVMQAGMMGEGGEVYLLDMGEPVKILDMANQLIRLHGLEPGKDVAIEFTGLRPGEKMFEELHKSEESFVPTSHKLINRVKFEQELSKADVDLLCDQLLRKTTITGSAQETRQILQQLVPTYKYKVQGELLKKETIS